MKAVIPNDLFDYQDEHGLPVDQTGDAADSAMRAGMIEISSNYGSNFLLSRYFNFNTGEFVRHPYQSPANNSKSFTIDQLTCILAGSTEVLAYAALLAYSNRNWSCQNTERDMPGSIKRPYPHKFWKDSRVGNDINTDTVFIWKKLPNEEENLRKGGIIETKLFDGSDAMQPQHRLLFYKKAQIEPPKLLKLLGENSMDLALWYHGKSDPSEENQMIAQCHVFGLLKEYKKVRPDWKQRLEKYWIERRNQPKLCKLVADYVWGQ